MGFIQEFKAFAMRGNVIDLAVGVIIGGAFGKITDSLVKDVIMPPVGLLMGGINFRDIKVTFKEPILDATGKVINEAVTLNIGSFLQAVVDFTILAFAIFIMIKAINTLKKKEEAKPAPAPEPSKQEVLLTEIRDLLKQK